MMTPKDMINRMVSMWEGGYQSYADDSGNWVISPDGTRTDVGTMRGVTPAALAAHRNVPAWTLTPGDMQAVTLDEAVDIGYEHYYLDPGISKLAWGPATASILDFAWGSGPVQSILTTQRIIGAKPDGLIGPITVDAYAAWESRLGWKAATDAIHDARASFYRYIAEINPDNQQFLDGWLNRDDWASAADKDWWDSWDVT